MRSAILFSCLLLGACAADPPPPPQADAAAVRPAANHALSDSIHKPIDRAKAANAPVEAADAAHDKALEDAGG
jgi:hypothetical protein